MIKVYLFHIDLTLGASYCNHSSLKSQINTLFKHLNHSSNKTARRKSCTVTFIFWSLRGGGGGQKRAFARPSLFMSRVTLKIKGNNGKSNGTCNCISGIRYSGLL